MVPKDSVLLASETSYTVGNVEADGVRRQDELGSNRAFCDLEPFDDLGRVELCTD